MREVEGRNGDEGFRVLQIGNCAVPILDSLLGRRR